MIKRELGTRTNPPKNQFALQIYLLYFTFLSQFQLLRGCLGRGLADPVLLDAPSRPERTWRRLHRGPEHLRRRVYICSGGGGSCGRGNTRWYDDNRCTSRYSHGIPSCSVSCSSPVAKPPGKYYLPYNSFLIEKTKIQKNRFAENGPISNRSFNVTLFEDFIKVLALEEL